MHTGPPWALLKLGGGGDVVRPVRGLLPCPLRRFGKRLQQLGWQICDNTRKYATTRTNKHNPPNHPSRSSSPPHRHTGPAGGGGNGVQTPCSALRNHQGAGTTRRSSYCITPPQHSTALGCVLWPEVRGKGGSGGEGR